mmetsp:Transcript_70713/g.207082  ORF Transcript_70713/g.207082 Transcript_70713/m.207082 type:complete len:241 (+) Transcript_70713:878-1600(+)
MVNVRTGSATLGLLGAAAADSNFFISASRTSLFRSSASRRTRLTTWPATSSSSFITCSSSWLLSSTLHATLEQRSSTRASATASCKSWCTACSAMCWSWWRSRSARTLSSWTSRLAVSRSLRMTSTSTRSRATSELSSMDLWTSSSSLRLRRSSTFSLSSVRSFSRSRRLLASGDGRPSPMMDVGEAAARGVEGDSFWRESLFWSFSCSSGFAFMAAPAHCAVQEGLLSGQPPRSQPQGS